MFESSMLCMLLHLAVVDGGLPRQQSVEPYRQGQDNLSIRIIGTMCTRAQNEMK